MARKKKEKKSGYGFDAEDADEALEAEGLRRTQMDVPEVELMDRDTSTSYYETYDEETGKLEGAVYLKDGNRKGLLALVKIIEEVKAEQDHYANLESIAFKGNLNVENPSTQDRLWDIDITLKGIEGTNLKSSAIKIQELGITEDDNVDSREFKIKGEASNNLLVKEFINTLPNADDILNINDMESELIKLQDQSAEAEELEEEEDEDDEEGDGGVEASSLESYGISIEKETTVTFAIALRNMFEKSISNVEVVKSITDEFSRPVIQDTSVGVANIEGSQIVWKIDQLEPETTVICKFTCDILVSTIDPIKTGIIEVSYVAASSYSKGLGIDKFDAYTSNRFYLDIIERDEEPGVWDCNLVFENTSEFIVDLFNADVYAPDDEGTKLIDIDPGDVPRLPAGAEWQSIKWVYEFDDYPSFRKLLEFRVVPDFQTQVNGAISISDVELSIASMTGELAYTITETAEPTIKEIEAMLIQVPTFKESDVIAVHKLVNNGSAPLNEIVVQQQFFTEQFQAPNADEIKILWDDSEIEVDSSAVSVEGDVFKIELSDLKDSSTGMFEPESKLEIQYPIHCINPAQDARFEAEVIYLANTYPISSEIEIKPDVPVISSQHYRRKFRISKAIKALSELGEYQIILSIENIGEMPLQNINLLDKVPDNFEYSNLSTKPLITDEVGADTLKWEIEVLEGAEKLEFTYDIKGKGKYSPSEAQLSF